MTQENKTTLATVRHPDLTVKLDNFTIPPKAFSIHHTNIHSLPHKYLLLQHYIAQFKQHQPDIIAITDNYITDEHHATSFPLDDYKHKHKTDVTMYFKSNLHISIPNYSMTGTATNIVQVHKTAQKNNPIHTVIGMYRRPRQDSASLTLFYTQLQSLLDTIIADHPTTELHIVGDLNINLLAQTHDSPMTRLILENTMHTTITTPTRYDSHYKTATLLDMNLTTYAAAVTAGTLPPISDHYWTYTIYHEHTPRATSQDTKTLSTTGYMRNREKILNQIMTSINDSRKNNENMTNDGKFQTILDSIQGTIQNFKTKPKRRRKPWCNTKIQKMIKKQHSLHQDAIRRPNARSIQKHKAFRQKLHKTITKEKRDHLTRLLEKTKLDPRKQAKILRSVIPNKSQARSTPSLIEHEGKEYTDPQDIANLFNDHYITIGHKTSLTIPNQDNYIALPPATKPPIFKLQPTTEEVVTKVLRRIKAHKASDIYEIKPIIIKDLHLFLAPILTELYNEAIANDDYPDTLKVTKLIELYKKGSKTKMPHYRPISLLPIIGKALDTIVNEQLMMHLTKHDIISPTQYAFRPNSNTTMALQAVLNNILKHKRNKQPTLAIYIDLSKAYDTVSHNKLFHKLQHDFNFTPNTLSFFKSYFRNRQQSTHTQHAKSRTQVITHGIPQGSTLSTTLFLLDINDIIRTVPNSTVYTYADDTTLIITTPNIADLQTIAQTELSNLINYFHHNNLVPNATKTNYTIFYPRNQHDQTTLSINDTKLEHKEKAKLLGLSIQSNLKHHSAINNIIKKLYPTIQAFKYANKLLSTDMMRSQYYTHIYPHLIGSIEIWGSEDTKKTYLRPLVKVQKRIVRLIKRAPPRTHTKPLMYEMGILSIHALYVARVCASMHPFVYPTEALNRPDHNHHYEQTSDVHDHGTRSARSGALYRSTERAHTTQTYTRIWNTIPAQIRNITQLESFNTELKLYLLEEQNSRL